MTASRPQSDAAAEKQTRAQQITRRIRDNFDRGSHAYARFESGSGFFALLLDRLLELAPPGGGETVLDVGCGTGASLDGLARQVGAGGQAVGVDVSLGMLRRAAGLWRQVAGQ